MGIKGLTKTITKYSPESITHENLYKLSGKKVAVDASLILYQQLLKSPGKIFKNSKGKITSHITGVFYKFMNYISLSINNHKITFLYLSSYLTALEHFLEALNLNVSNQKLKQTFL